MKKIWITFSTSFKIWWIWIKTFNINSFLYSLFLILMIKTNYDHLEKLKELGQLDSCFWSQVYEISYTTIKKKKPLKVHTLNFEKVFYGIEGKLGQSSVNGLLNNSSSVNTLPLPYIMEVDSLRGKMFQCNNQSRRSLSWLCTISIQCLNMDYPLA